MPHENSETGPHAKLTHAILGVAYHVQDRLGLGLLEKPYQLCLAHGLRQAGHRVVTEASLDLAFEGLLVPDAYRLDILVDDTVVLEVKAIDELNAWHEAQLLTYLRLSGLLGPSPEKSRHQASGLDRQASLSPSFLKPPGASPRLPWPWRPSPGCPGGWPSR